jgi:hypothetical protein
MPHHPLTVTVRKAFNDACRDFSYAMAERGFSRTKTRLWVRLSEHSIDVLSLFRAGSSYGAPISSSVDIRISAAMRLPRDINEYLALNGPQSDVSRTRAGKYHLRFNAKSRHMYERCLTDLVRFVDAECDPWFVEMRGKPLATDHLAKGDRSEPSDVTRKLLGIDRLLDI